MENLSNLEIVGIIVLVLIFGGLAWRIAKSAFKVFIVAILIFAGIYFVKPELLDKWFGDGTSAKIEQTAGSVVDVADSVIEVAKPIVKDAIDSIK